MELGNVYKLNGEYILTIGNGYLKKELGKVIVIDKQYNRKLIAPELISNLQPVKQLMVKELVQKGTKYNYIKTQSGKVYGKSGNPVDASQNKISAAIVALFA